MPLRAGLVKQPPDLSPTLSLDEERGRKGVSHWFPRSSPYSSCRTCDLALARDVADGTRCQPMCRQRRLVIVRRHHRHLRDLEQRRADPLLGRGRQSALRSFARRRDHFALGGEDPPSDSVAHFLGCPPHHHRRAADRSDVARERVDVDPLGVGLLQFHQHPEQVALHQAHQALIDRIVGAAGGLDHRARLLGGELERCELAVERFAIASERRVTDRIAVLAEPACEPAIVGERARDEAAIELGAQVGRQSFDLAGVRKLVLGRCRDPLGRAFFSDLHVAAPISWLVPLPFGSLSTRPIRSGFLRSS